MNVRRGMFRLWVVASAVFVIGMGIASYSGLHDEFRDAYTNWDAEFSKYGGSALLPVDCAEARGSLGSDFTRNNDGLCWYETANFRRLYSEYKDMSNAVLFEKLYAKVGQPLKHFHPWLKLMETAGIAFGGPLAVLALGASLLWALAGFRGYTGTKGDSDSPGT